MSEFSRNEVLSETLDAVSRFTEKHPISMYEQKTPDGLSAALWEHSPRSQTFSGHKNTILAVSLRGDARMERVRNGSTVWRGFAPGTTVILKASEATDWILDGRFEMLHVYLDEDTSRQFCGKEGFPMSTPFRDPVLYQIARTADYVLRESDGRGNFVEPMLDAMRHYCLDRYIGAGLPLRSSGNTYVGGLSGFSQRKLEEFIQHRLGEPILVEELAELVKLSPAHFSRAFLTTYNVSPHKFLLERRIDKAAELLHSSSLQVEEIALKTGFSSSSHLGVQFKRSMAKTPSQYRRFHSRKFS